MKHHYLETFPLICKICIAKILLALCPLYVIEMITVYCLNLMPFNEYTVQYIFVLYFIMPSLNKLIVEEPKLIISNLQLSIFSFFPIDWSYLVIRNIIGNNSMPFFKELNHVKNAITEFRVWKSSGADFASYIQCVLPTKTNIIIIYIPAVQIVHHWR